MAAVAAKPITVAEFEPLGETRRVELVKGEIQELPMPGGMHGVLCAWLVVILQRWADTHGEGLILSNDTFIQTHFAPDSVRGADVCYIRKDRLPGGQIPEGTLRVAPDLVIEVQSPSDRWDDVLDKVIEYLTIGVREVWVVDGAKRRVNVFRPDAGPMQFANSDELSSPDVLPGFATPVSEFFRNV